MDGIPIGRKVNVFAQNEYDSLIRTINLMFPTTNICKYHKFTTNYEWFGVRYLINFYLHVYTTDSGADRIHSEKYHVLIYEDMEGDWLMVGDVPWE
jgi:auxin-responsive protein IAA